MASDKHQGRMAIRVGSVSERRAWCDHNFDGVGVAQVGHRFWVEPAGILCTGGGTKFGLAHTEIRHYQKTQRG